MPHPTFVPFPPDRTTVLEVTGLQGGPGEMQLFDHLDLRLPAGVSAVIGDEGTGKTSLLRLLCGDLQATAGQWRLLDGPQPMSMPQAAAVFWTDLRLPQHDTDTPLECWAAWRPSLPAWSQAVQNTLIDALHMAPHLGKRLNMLSTGSRRKVGLIGALASGATVTLLDQPFVSLDQASIGAIQSFLHEAAAHPSRSWVIADYEAPAGITLASLLQL